MHGVGYDASLPFSYLLMRKDQRPYSAVSTQSSVNGTCIKVTTKSWSSAMDSSLDMVSFVQAEAFTPGVTNSVICPIAGVNELDNIPITRSSLLKGFA